MRQIEFSSLTNAAFFSVIEPDIDHLKRLINLVQDNQDFFGDPPARASCIKLAADKLEKLIEFHKILSLHQECSVEIKVGGL